MARPEALLLLFVLVFSPLAFGTVEPWSRALAAGAAFAGLAAALRRRTREGHLLVRALPGALPLLLFLGLLLLQLVPLPPSLLRSLSPATHARWEAALGAGALPWLPLSLDPLATLHELVRFGACAALYALTVQLLARHERLRAVTAVVAVFAGLLAFEAILQHLVAPGRLYFVRAPAGGGHPFGPFVNKNHYADLMAMLTPVLLGLFLGRGFPRGGAGVRARLAELLARPETSVRLLAGFAALLCAASLVVSLSRGATVAISAALLVLGGGLLAHRVGRRRPVAAALLAYAFFVFVGWFGWAQVVERFASLRANPEVVDTVRAGLWRDTLRMAGDFPALGAGVGSFERLYPSYRTVPGRFAIAHAHNDHLELLAGGGAVGLALHLWFAAAVLLAVARACRRRRDPPAVALAYGALAGCVAFLVHGASDFSLAIGANALYYYFLLGLAVSAAHTLERGAGEETLLPRRRLPAAAGHAAVAAGLAATLWLAADLSGHHAWRLAGEEVTRGEGLGLPPAGARRLIVQASRLLPLDPAPPAALARIAAREGNAGEALRLTRESLRRLPLEPAVLAQFAVLRGSTGDPAGARASCAAAIAADPASAVQRAACGAWLLSRGERDEGAALLRGALERDPGRTPGAIALLALAGFDDERVAAAVPPVPEALRHLARYAETTGNAGLAARTWRRLLEADPRNPHAAAALRRLGSPAR